MATAISSYASTANETVEDLFKALGVGRDERVAAYVRPVRDAVKQKRSATPFSVNMQETRNWINDYLQNSHGHHHYRMQLGALYTIERPADKDFVLEDNQCVLFVHLFAVFALRISFSKLLWHGTSHSNVLSILQNGYHLGRATGMFGPGAKLYF